MTYYMSRAQINKAAKRRLHKVLSQPARKAQEECFAAEHAADRDWELYEYVKNLKRKRGKEMNPANTVGYRYIIQRLGRWNELMFRINTELEAEKRAERKRAEDAGAEPMASF